MLKQTIFAATAMIALASAALPLLVTHASAAACTSNLCGGPPPGGNPPPPGGNPPPPDGGGGSNKPAPDLDDDPNFNQDGTPKINMLISCKVPKGAAETTDVQFRNIGQKTIPSGTPVTWYITKTGQGGQFILPHDLPAGKDLTAAELLKAGVPANAPCLSKL